MCLSTAAVSVILSTASLTQLYFLEIKVLPCLKWIRPSQLPYYFQLLFNPFTGYPEITRTDAATALFNPHPIIGSLGPHELAPQTVSRSVQLFLHGSPVCPNTQTHKQTKLRATSVAIGHIYATHAMWFN